MPSSLLQSEIDFGRALVERGLLKEEEVRESLDLLRQMADLRVSPLPRLADLLARKGHRVALTEADTVRLGEPAPARSNDWPEEAVTAARDPANLVDKYVRVRKVGVGGMGEVWKAWDRDLGRWVALKFLRTTDEEERSRFRLEAQTAARLDDPHITAVFEANERYIAMQFVEGRSLSAFPRDNRRTLIEVLRQAATAVHHAHRQGVIHRDLKPANILVSETGRVHAFVTDFGLAKRMNVESSISVSGTVVGTPGYMSPEQARGSKDLDGRSDVYSLGATLYELLTGRPPFRDDNVYETFRQVIESDPTPIRLFEPRVERDLETIAMKCLEKDPSRRYPNALELALDLERFLQGEPVQARPISRIARLWRKARKHKAVLLPVTVVFLAGAAFGGWTLFRMDRISRERRRAEERLAKSQHVARVVSRWVTVHAALRKAQELSCDPRASETERDQASRTLDREIVRFLEDTPRDAESQATARAFSGWAQWAAGRHAEGYRWIVESQALESSSPYGYFMEALILFARYAWESTPIIVRAGGGRVEREPSLGEASEAASVRERIMILIRKIRESPLWAEGNCADLAFAVEGMRAVQDGDAERAEEALTAALRAPDLRIIDTALFGMRARIRYLRGNLGGALEDIREVSRVWRDHAQVHTFTGDVDLLQALRSEEENRDPKSLLDEALSAYDRVLQADPNDVYARSNRAFAYLRIGMRESAAERDPRPWYEKATADCDEAVRNGPRRFWTYHLRGVVSYHEGLAMRSRGIDPGGRWEKAIADFETSLSLAPAFHDARVNLGLVYRERGETERAIAEFTAALEGDEGLLEARNGRGLAHRDQGRWEQAISDFQAAIAARSGYVGARYNLGDTYVALGATQEDPRASLEKAIACYSEVLKLKPDYIDALCNRAVAHTHLGQAQTTLGADPRPSYEKAIEDCTEGLRFNSEWAFLYNNRGNAYWKRGLAEQRLGLDPKKSLESALADLDTAVLKKPDYASAHVIRGAICDGLGRTADAVAAFERALEIDPRLTYVRPFLEDARKRLPSAP